jgi:hypothetical protein
MLSVAAFLGLAFAAFLSLRHASIAAPEAVAPPAVQAASKPSMKGHQPARILQVVARRFRARREADRASPGKPADRSAPQVKVTAPADAKAAPAAPADAKPAPSESKAVEAPPDPKPAASPDPKAAQPADPKAAAKAEAPAPGEWSDAEIIAALRDCLRRLAPLGAEVEVSQPIKEERCGAPAPVVLKRIGLGAGRVELQPPAMVNCAMVSSLHAWVEKTLQPAAQELLGSPVVRIRNASGYACRNRIGTTYHADRLSEHALANAIDIFAFVTADGRTVEVLKQWGPTARELREEQEKAAEAAAEAKAAAGEAEKAAAAAARAAARAPRGAKREEAKAEADRTQQAAQRKRGEAEKLEAERRDLMRTAELYRLGRGTDGGQPPRHQRSDKEKTAGARGLTPVALVKDGAPPAIGAEAAFLRQLHRGACATFGTVLGPDANEAHRNHFHFDLAHRKRSAFCE